MTVSPTVTPAIMSLMAKLPVYLGSHDKMGSFFCSCFFVQALLARFEQQPLIPPESPPPPLESTFFETV